MYVLLHGYTDSASSYGPLREYLPDALALTHRELAAAVPELSDPVDRAFAREFQESMLARPVPADFLEMVIDESASLPAAVWRDGIRRLATGPVPAEVGPVTAPTLVLWGDRDIVCSRAEQDELVAAIPGAELVVYEGDGHSPHWERPAQVAADIAAFVSRRGLSRPRSSAAR